MSKSCYNSLDISRAGEKKRHAGGLAAAWAEQVAHGVTGDSDY